MENKGIKMSKGLKQEIKEEPSSDSDEDAVENEGINMIDSLKQEIKEEPSSDGAEDAVENEGINMIDSLKQEIKEEPSSDGAEDAVENEGINMIDSLKQEVKEEPSSEDEDSDDDDDYEDSLPDTVVKSEEDWELRAANENDYEDSLPDTVLTSEEDWELRAANDNDYESMIFTNRQNRERANRTVFVSNVQPKPDVSAFWKKFRQFGIIEIIRFRGPANPIRTGIRIKPLHPKPTRKLVTILKTDPWKTDCYFITYKDEDSAGKALLMNGKKWDGNILRVNTVLRKEKPSKGKALSLGNLPPTIEENELWELFEQCGHVKFVRIIRDRMTGMARGIGYIVFESVKEAMLAMHLNGTTIRNTQLHVYTYTPQPKSKRKEKKRAKLVAKRKLKRSSSEIAFSTFLKKMKTEEAIKTASNNAWRPKNKKGIKERLRNYKQRVKSVSNPQDKGKGSV